MEEIRGILEPAGTAEIVVPYYHSPAVFRDPTHRRFFTEETMDYFAINRPLSCCNNRGVHRFSARIFLTDLVASVDIL